MKIRKLIAALALLALMAVPALAASVPLWTGPAGSNPAPDMPPGMGTINGTIANINANLAPPNAGLAQQTTTHVTTGSIPPVLTSCGTSPSVVGSDTAGTVTMGTGTPTGCVITFATAYVSVPICVVVWPAQALASQSYVTSATAITLTQTATSSNKVNYVCIGQAGG